MASDGIVQDSPLQDSVLPDSPLILPSLDPQVLQDQALAEIRAKLRPAQQQIADWSGGTLAVSAVPGSGKSTAMAGAAVLAIAHHKLNARRQLILVTFTRSAAANLKAKIRADLRELGLPLTGFVVQTLHSLALNIATRHPDLSGLNLDRLTLVTPNQNNRLIRTCVEHWISENPDAFRRLIEGTQFDGEETERLRRQSVLRTEVLPNLANTTIREAKSSGLTPDDLRRIAATTPDHYGILAIAAGLYEHYQHLLRVRNFLDYDEMVLAALKVLSNPTACAYWRSQVFAVFEDEAQDSSPLQIKLLEILATDPHDSSQINLVRVGDPNQAINSTFTPADPVFFRQFCQTCQPENRLVSMNQAGRSTPLLIAAANFTLQWVNQQIQTKLKLTQPPTPNPQLPSPIPHPELPFRPQSIQPVPPNDPQPNANPAPLGQGLELYTPQDTYQTVDLMRQRLRDLFAQNPKLQAAILVRENKQAQYLAEKLSDLKDQGITVYDVSLGSRITQIPAEMLSLLQFLDRPHSPDALKAALIVLSDRQLIPRQDLNAITAHPEQFLYPGPLDPPQPDPIRQARQICTGLLRARLELPAYQLIAFLALTLHYDQAELATAEKLADRIAQQTGGHSSLATVLGLLHEISQSERFEPVDPEAVESRYVREGQLTIITMHKAKGLDWDAVFIPFLHEHLIPGALRVLSQSQFLGKFTLDEVARAQIRACAHSQPIPPLSTAWKQAGYLKTAEEFRLLYVAMTRAKRLLWMSAAHQAPFSWNNPHNLDVKTPCPVFSALQQQFPQAVMSLPTAPPGLAAF